MGWDRVVPITMEEKARNLSIENMIWPVKAKTFFGENHWETKLYQHQATSEAKFVKIKAKQIMAGHACLEDRLIGMWKMWLLCELVL